MKQLQNILERTGSVNRSSADRYVYSTYVLYQPIRKLLITNIIVYLLLCYIKKKMVELY